MTDGSTSLKHARHSAATGDDWRMQLRSPWGIATRSNGRQQHVGGRSRHRCRPRRRAAERRCQATTRERWPAIENRGPARPAIAASSVSGGDVVLRHWQLIVPQSRYNESRRGGKRHRSHDAGFTRGDNYADEEDTVAQVKQYIARYGTSRPGERSVLNVVLQACRSGRPSSTRRRTCRHVRGSPPRLAAASSRRRR